MSANRKLQSEIDKVLKKVEEGVAIFDDIWDKVYTAGQQSLKEKYEGDLKKEIKKLQRLRDQIKTWISSGDIKDKSQLIDSRKLIESKMEQFKICEKDTKTKAYSKEGLAREARLDPKEADKEDKRTWLNESIEKLGEIIDSVEADIEKISNSKGKSKNKEQIEKMEKRVLKNRWHIARLEQILRLLDCDDLDPAQLEDIKDGVDYYIESARDDDGALGIEDEFDIYEDLQLDLLPANFADMKDDDVDANPVAQSNSSISSSGNGSGGESLNAQEEAGEGKLSDADIDSVDSLKRTKKLSIANAVTNAALSTIGKPIPQRIQPGVKPAKLGTQSTAALASTGHIPANIPSSGQPSVKASTVSTTTSSSSTSTSNQQPIRSTANAPSGRQEKKTPVLPVAGQKSSTTTDDTVKEVTRKNEARDDKTVTKDNQTPSWAHAATQRSSSSVVLNTSNSLSPATTSASQASPTDPIPVINIGSSLTAAIASNKTNVVISNPPTPISGAVTVLQSASKIVSSAPQVSIAPSPVPVVSQTRSTSSQFTLSKEHLLMMSLLQQSFLCIPPQYDTERTSSVSPRNAYPVHNSFPTTAAPIVESHGLFDKLQTDSLFLAFYHQQGTYQQYLAARQLKKQSWRFHKKYLTWFQRHEEPKVTNDDYEEGTYVYFDYESGWCQRIKSEFKFEYSFLEDDLSK